MAAVLDMQMVRHRGGELSAATIDRAARERAAIVLRNQGLSFDEIARELGFADRSGARKAVERGLSRWMRETDEDFRARELERTEMVVDRLWPLIDQDAPDLKAVDRLMHFMNYRAKIKGLFSKRPEVPETYPGAPNYAAEQKADNVTRYLELTRKLFTGLHESGYGPDEEPEESYDQDVGQAVVLATDVAAENVVDDSEDDWVPVNEGAKPGRWVDGKFVGSSISGTDDAGEMRVGTVDTPEVLVGPGPLRASALSIDRADGP